MRIPLDIQDGMKGVLAMAAKDGNQAAIAVLIIFDDGSYGQVARPIRNHKLLSDAYSAAFVTEARANNAELRSQSE